MNIKYMNSKKNGKKIEEFNFNKVNNSSVISQIGGIIKKHINLKIVGYGFMMASIDLLVFPFMKLYSIGKIKTLWFMGFAMIVYGMQPWIFLQSLQYESMTIMNLYWDLSSDLLVTLMGLFVFKEEIGYYKKIGMVFTVLALFFMSYEDVKKK